MAAGLPRDRLKRASELRKHADRDLVPLLLEQQELRERAVAKFPRHAAKMLFTRRGLESATGWWVALHKAARLRGIDDPGGSVATSAGRGDGVAAADLCCGIGGDLLALAATAGGAATFGVDADEVTAGLAGFNVRALRDGDPPAGSGGDASGAGHTATGPVEVRCADVADAVDGLLAEGVRRVHIDPEWRTDEGHRNRRMDRFRPPAEVVAAIAGRFDGAGVKVSSAADFREAGWDCTWEVISEGGDCKQAVGWFGDRRGAARTWATVLPSRAARAATGPAGSGAEGGVGGSGAGVAAVRPRVVLSTGAPDPAVRAVGEFVYEPDAAVIRAGVIGELAAQHGWGLVEPAVAYLTGDAAVSDPAAVGFRVRDVLPLSGKKIRDHLREHGFGRPEVKTRAISLDVDRLSAEWSGRGDRPVVLLCTRVAGRPTAIVAERLVPGGPWS